MPTCSATIRATPARTRATRWCTTALPPASTATPSRGEEFIARAPQLRIPFLLMQGRDDQVVDPVGSQRFFARAVAPDRAFCLYPGLYHEIFNELDHEKVFQDIESWLTQRTNGHLTGLNPPP